MVLYALSKMSVCLYVRPFQMVKHYCSVHLREPWCC